MGKSDVSEITYVPHFQQYLVASCKNSKAGNFFNSWPLLPPVIDHSELKYTRQMYLCFHKVKTKRSSSGS